MPTSDNLHALELDAVLAHSHDHVVIADADGRILKASESCAGVYGLPLRDFINASTYELQRQGILSPSITVRVLEQRRAMPSDAGDAHRPLGDGERLSGMGR